MFNENAYSLTKKAALYIRYPPMGVYKPSHQHNNEPLHHRQLIRPPIHLFSQSNGQRLLSPGRRSSIKIAPSTSSSLPSQPPCRADITSRSLPDHPNTTLQLHQLVLASTGYCNPCMSPWRRRSTNKLHTQRISLVYQAQRDWRTSSKPEEEDMQAKTFAHASR